MYSLSSSLRNRAILASLMLPACSGEVIDGSDLCNTPELGSAHDSAFAWSAEGASNARCDGEQCSMPELTALGADASSESASCTLAGIREGLRYGRGRDPGRCRKHGRGHDGRGRGGHGHGGHGHGGGKHRDDLGECKRDGRLTGETAAVAFCELSIALGGLGVDDLLPPGPDSRCSRKFEAACRRTFDQAVVRYGELIDDPSADCRPFAQGEFREAYEVARFNQCLFSVD